jgi:hypothetical protein
MQYAEIIAELPVEVRLPIARLVDALKEEFTVKRTDFEELKTVVRELAQAQQRTEIRMEELVQAQKELAEAQKRTESRVEELAEAQQQTQTELRELAQAQKHTDESVRELAQAQKRTEDALAAFSRTFAVQTGGLGARWGLQTEEAFRQGMRAILQEVGFTTERFLDYDTQGEVFGYPEQIELDVVMQNGKVIVVEIKSALDKGALYQFARKVEFYARKTGRQVNRKLVVTPYAENRAKEAGVQLGVEICTDVNALN